MNTNIYRISKMSNHSVGMLAIRLLESVDSYDFEEAKVSKPYSNLVNINEEYILANQRYNIPDLTKEIIDLDYQRGKTFDDVLAFLRGQTRSRDVAINSASTMLLSKLSVYDRSKLKGKKGDRSFEFTQIVAILNDPSSKAAIATVKMVELSNELISYHTSYETKHKLRSDLRINNIAPSTIRPRLNRAIIDYLNEVSAMYLRTGEEGWRKLLQDLDNRVGEITLSKRSTPPGEEKEDTKSDSTESVA